MRRWATLLGAVGLDLWLGEPSNRWHPVAAAGKLLQLGYDPLRARSAQRQLMGGAAMLGGTCMAAAGAALALQRLGRGRGWAGVALTAAALKPMFALRALRAEGLRVADSLDNDRLAQARSQLQALNSRPTAHLDRSLVAAAAISSLAENLTDSVVAPWIYYAVLGLPGAAVYRVVNTADAMYGYRGELEWLGKAAARTDDVLNWLPSRAAALALVAATGPVLGRDAARRAIRTWREDASRTASPNGGHTMSVMAGSLHRRLEKQGCYVLGGRYASPDAADIRRAAQLVTAAAGIVATIVVGALALRGRRHG